MNKTFSTKRSRVSFTPHQICTPLTAIKGYTSLIQEGNFGTVSVEIQNVLKIIQKSTDGLIEIVRQEIDK